MQTQTFTAANVIFTCREDMYSQLAICFMIIIFFKLYVGMTVPLITPQQPKMIHVFVGFA